MSDTPETAKDPFAGIPNADDSERHQFDAPDVTGNSDAGPQPNECGRADQAGYDQASARYIAIIRNMGKIDDRLAELRDELEAEFRDAEAELARFGAGHGASLTADLKEIERLEAMALGRLVGMFPWARLA